MSERDGFFSRLSAGQKWSLGLGMFLIAGVVAVGGWWLMRSPKAVLFSDLGEGDAGVIVAELDRMKQPYEISQDGHAVMVPQDAVHKPRMALMARPLPLHGAVGFELFNNTEFGVSDFVQKVNYQRALQGELTRTIMSLEQVQNVRVHLALPDQALFRKDGPKAKASVTLTTRPGQSLQVGQVAGIQRLVAASVPEVKPDDVTVVDHHGSVLSRAFGEDIGATSAQLDARQALEQHLTRKAAQLLDRMFKPGEALVTVDVVLNHQQSKVITESVLPGMPGQKDQPPAGVVVRERTTSRDGIGSDAGSGSTNASATVTSQEVDYQTGKRTEQVSSQGGNVARLQVAVVVRSPLSNAEVSKVKTVIGASVGLDAARGDQIAVYSMADGPFADARGVADRAGAMEAAAGDKVPAAGKAAPPVPQAQADTGTSRVTWILAGLVMLAALGAAGIGLARRRHAPGPQDASRKLTDGEREAMLRTLQQWVATGEHRA